jgi:hypothetical protein
MVISSYNNISSGPGPRVFHPAPRPILMKNLLTLFPKTIDGLFHFYAKTSMAIRLLFMIRLLRVHF